MLQTPRRSAVVAMLLVALLCGLASPDPGLSNTTFVARWVGLRVWYATQLTLRLAPRLQTPSLFPVHSATSYQRTFPSGLIQPRV